MKKIVFLFFAAALGGILFGYDTAVISETLVAVGDDDVTAVLNETEGKFTIRDIEWKCPGVSKETIKSVLKAHPNCFVCEGRGVSARWLRIKDI